MTYARSYASNRKPKKAISFRRSSNKRKIEKLHFRQNTYRGNPLSWQKVKTIFLGTCFAVCAASLLAGFSLLLVIGYQYLLTVPYFCIKSPEGIKIEGQALSNPVAVLQEMQLKPGSSLLAIQPLKVEKALLQQPWIEHAALTRVWPDQVHLKIREHHPLALVKLDHKLYLMDTRGILFKVMEPHDPHDFPVITGLQVEHFQRVEGNLTPLLAKVFDFMEILKEKNNYLNLATVSEINVDSERGITIYPAELNLGVSIGFQGHSQKLANLQKVLPQLKQHGDLANIDKIDLNYPQRVLVSRKNTDHSTP
jgi:cell division protein FtsQ